MLFVRTVTNDTNYILSTMFYSFTSETGFTEPGLIWIFRFEFDIMDSGFLPILLETRGTIIEPFLRIPASRSHVIRHMYLIVPCFGLVASFDTLASFLSLWWHHQCLTEELELVEVEIRVHGLGVFYR